MNQKVIKGCNIMPQLDNVCGFYMRKDKNAGFVSCKDHQSIPLIAATCFLKILN